MDILEISKKKDGLVLPFWIIVSTNAKGRTGNCPALVLVESLTED